MKHRLAALDLRTFVDTIYLPQKLRITGEKTRAAYRMIVRQLAETIGRTPRVRDLNDEIICLMLRRLTDSGLSLHTVQQRRNYLVALANWCSRRGVIGWWVNIERIKTPEVIPRAWTMQELRKLFAACGRYPGHYGDIAAADFWLAFHACAWDTAERTGAILAIVDGWLCLETGTLTIPAEARKGGQKAASYELKPHTVSLLRPLVQAAKERPDGKVFAYSKSRWMFYHDYGRLLKLAGLPTTRKFKPQRIRRTFATFLEIAGGDATAALKHSCRRVTKESYIDPTMYKPDSPNRLLPPIDGESPAA